MQANLRLIQRHLKVSIFVAIAIALIELVGGILSNSLSLVSDAVHVFGDILAIFMSLFAVSLATRQHKGSMTYGYHRAEVLASMANGILLCAISVWIAVEAYQKLYSPKPIDAVLVMALASIGLAGNLVIMKVLRQDQERNLNVKSAFSHVLYDTISSIAVICVGAFTFFTGVLGLDPLVALLIAVFIARSGFKIAKDSAHILLEGAPSHVDIEEIRASILKIEKVLEVHDLHVWTIASGMNALSGHIVVPDQILSEADKAVQTINRMLLEKYGITHTTLQVEPEKKVSFRRSSNDLGDRGTPKN
ncbi:MAG TPA: cation diffusion facilitator family transporter [Nitrososphaeraceae archaeon]|nr:cation diffusion facilitator family transporter [Nitrososphaeraceae archaeon]